MERQTGWLEACDLDAAVGWRAEYHLSSAAVLDRLGRNWKSLSGSGAQVLDGWRFSENPASDWYRDNILVPESEGTSQEGGSGLSSASRQRAAAFRAAIEEKRYYRMRHVGEMCLLPEQEQFEPPQIEEESYCVQHFDVIVRRVGRIGAAIVAGHHRRHPVDGNLAIVRGLKPYDAVWLAFCLNHPLYQDFLAQRSGLTTLVRVGLKQLAGMPFSCAPMGWDKVARQFVDGLEGVAKADEDLFRLRSEARDWVELRAFDLFEADGVPQEEARFFSAKDIGDVLTFGAVQCSRVQRWLLKQGGVRVGDLAHVAPVSPRESEERPKVLKISQLDDHFGFSDEFRDEADVRWRTQKRPLHRYDVLVSSFVQDPKVAYVHGPVMEAILPTDQLVTLCFHVLPGAYALLLETKLATWQMERLAAGTVQRFIRPRTLKEVVLPNLELGLGRQWHGRLNEILDRRSAALARMKKAQEDMLDLFYLVHPAFEADHISRRPS